MGGLSFDDYLPVAPGLWRRPDWQWEPQQLRALVLDIDGVVLQVRDVFRWAASDTLETYFAAYLGWWDEGQHERLLLPEETELFKLAGRFNNDWDLTAAAVLFYLWKSQALGGLRDPVRLRREAPSIREFAQDLRGLGGGLESAIRWVSARTQPQGAAGPVSDGELPEALRALWSREAVQRICCEHYAGVEWCERLYGYKPRYVFRNPGLFSRERVVLRAPLLEGIKNSGITLGVVTGRLRVEAEMALAQAGVLDQVPAERVGCEDGPFRKPDPRALEAVLAGVRGLALYVGDTVDDHAMVEAYARTPHRPAAALFCAVLTGAHGPAAASIFAGRRAELIAEDINALLEALLQRSVWGQRRVSAR